VKIAALALAVGAAALLFAAGARAQHDDAYLAGYVTAVIERDLGLDVVSVEVHQGNARVVVRRFGDEPAERIAAAISRIVGIHEVDVREADSEEAPPPTPVPGENGGRAVEQPSAIEILPRAELFDPLIADPRQPHFSASYLWYLRDSENTHVGSANFGETFALFGGALDGTHWELGILGGVFSIFDLDAPSFDLVNSDYWFGPTFSLRHDWLSAQVRLYHQSSHLGDEFLLDNPGFDRMNLSYEGIDLLISADPWSWLRIYAGGGSLVHSDPSDLHPLSAQGGGELKSPWAFLGNRVRPIAAFDYGAREENHWGEELSFAGGIQLENPALSRMRVQILGTWFKGNTRNGQFFQRRIESLGIGVHFHF
jgi:uncharacterized protein DUF1207